LKQALARSQQPRLLLARASTVAYGVGRWTHLARRRAVPYAFLAPFFLMFGVFWLYPICYSLFLSFTRWDGLTPLQIIGFANYVSLLGDDSFLTAVTNTVLSAVVYVAILVALATGFGIALGWLDVRARALFRTALFLPVTMALVVSSVVFSFVYARDYGLVNQVITSIGLPARDWLGNPSLALWSIVALRIWRNTGYYAIFVISGLQAIPGSQYEAARVDGASAWAIIRHITLPLLTPMLLYVTVVSSIHALQLFDEPWVLTGGGPGQSTTTMVMYLYQNTFKYFRLGYGAAISWVLTVIILGFALVQARLLRSQIEQ
jgi:lactose/L-arabinose transport system permease protein